MNTKLFSGQRKPNNKILFKQKEKSCNSSSKCKRENFLWEDLEKLSNKVSQFVASSGKEGRREQESDIYIQRNSILKSASEDKLIFSKRKIFDYSKTNLLTLTMSKDDEFSDNFLFWGTPQYDQTDCCAKWSETDNSPSLIYSSPFKDENDSFSLIFSKEKNPLYSQSFNSNTLIFGESPEETINRISKHKKSIYEKEVKKLKYTLSSFPVFKLKNNAHALQIIDESSQIHINCSEESCESSPLSGDSTNGGKEGESCCGKEEGNCIKEKKRKEMKEKRKERNVLEKVKRRFCEENNVNYDKVVKMKEGKVKLNRIILANGREFKKIKKKVKEKVNRIV